MLETLRLPIGWSELAKRTGAEVMSDNCLGLAAQLAYYFFLALFPALLFLVALISFIPVDNLMDAIVGTLSRIAPGEVLSIIQDQILAIAQGEAGGLLTFGMLGTIWAIVQWPVVFAMVATAIALVFYYAPDAEQDWTWITPGSILATILWLLVSLGFKFYVTNFGSYNATYGAIGGVIILLLWFYVSALAVLVGAELNAEIEHASPYGKDPGEKKLGEKKKIGPLAQRTWEERAPGRFDRRGAGSTAAWMPSCHHSGPTRRLRRARATGS